MYFQSSVSTMKAGFVMFSCRKSQIRGFFQYENHLSKLIHLDIITHTNSNAFCDGSFFPPFSCGSTSCNILNPALMELSRSEKLLTLSGSFSLIREQTSFSDMWFLMDLQYFSHGSISFWISFTMLRLVGLNLSQARESKRQAYSEDFLMISIPIRELVYWNLMVKQAKVSFLLLPMLMDFRFFQNYLVIQLAMFDIERRYTKQHSTSMIFLLKNRLRCSYLQVALFLSMQIRVSFNILAIDSSVSSLNFIDLFSVSFLILMRVFWTELSMKGWTPKQRKQRRQPADHTSHLAEQGQFMSCCGDEQMGVPLSRERFQILESQTQRAQPKSAILTSLFLVSKTFSGLRSR